MPSLPLLDEPLRGEQVTLRDAAERDIPEVLFAHDDDPELYIRLGQERPPSGAQLGRWAEHAAADRAAGAQATLTILAPGSDLCRGQITVDPIDWDHARAELRVWLVPQMRGRGMGSGALRLAAVWLLERGALQRVHVVAGAGNRPAIAAARAAGFAEEGVLRGYLRERGARVDAVMLSLVRDDLHGRA